MLHIILLILKIIGIVLLCVIGLIMALLIALLFVPVRYRAQVRYTADETFGRSSLSWLCHLVHVHMSHDGKTLVYYVRLFGFLLIDSRKPKKEKKQKEDKVKKTKKHKAKKSEIIKAPEPAEAKSEPDDTAQSDIKALQAENAEKVDESLNEEKSSDHTIDKADGELKAQSFEEKAKAPEEQLKSGHKKGIKGLFEKLRNTFLKVPRFFESLRQSLASIGEKLKNLGNKKDKLIALLTSAENRPAFFLLRQSGFKLIAHVVPTQVRGYIHFGTSDPASTGYCLGILGIFYPLYAKHLEIRPDFEHKIFETEVFIKGRIRSFTMLRIVLKIILNKDLKRIRNEFQNL